MTHASPRTTAAPSRRAARSPRAFGVAAALALAGALLLPGSALAQSCFGSPNAPGEFSMQADVSFLDGGTGYAVTSLANIEGPYGLGASLGAVDPDVGDRQTLAAVRALYEWTFPLLSACPVVEAEWTTSTGDDDTDRWAFPLGVSAGAVFGLSPSVEMIPSGRAGLLYSRVSAGGQTATDSDVFLDAGATFSFVPFFARGEIRAVTGDASDTTFRVSAGVRF